ncbi:cytochrome c [Rhizobiales bacterium]|uniref:c-type cytochrome n=1 Tax=Hongsoonwoonella zoysiae TaxID=2821844 RepID=UPI0015613458|nr:cytochrome c [Hongsoonwoonella zoysiae]NRG18791.1 cytochrome c [Hongsoonwoonella zoysiae]
MKKVVTLACAAIALTAGLAALTYTLGEVESRPFRLMPDNASLISQGREIYAAYCASCHGESLEGHPNWQEQGADGLFPAPPHDASGHTWHHADELLFKITKYGVAKAAGLENHSSAMPAYEGVLSDAQIVAVLSFIKSRWPKEIRDRHDTLNARTLR